jgi:hypothetical protein
VHDMENEKNRYVNHIFTQRLFWSEFVRFHLFLIESRARKLQQDCALSTCGVLACVAGHESVVVVKSSHLSDLVSATASD